MDKLSRKLNWLNFFAADVGDGIGPFLAVFLLTHEHWSEGRIGIVLTVLSLATVVAQTPAGAWLDVTYRKRLAIGVATCGIGAASLAIPFFPSFTSDILLAVVIGTFAAVIPPAIAAITLGVVGRDRFARQTGSNQAFNHAGNLAFAVLVGAAGYYIAPGSVFGLVAVMSVGTTLCVMWIPHRAINHSLARGGEDAPQSPDAPIRFLHADAVKPFVLFTGCVALFHFANAAMLPLVGQELALTDKRSAPAYISVCIIVAQFVMVPMAILVGRKADKWGRKPLFLVAFAVLPIRGVLYTLVEGPAALIAVQALDGIGAGIYGALFFLVVADLTRGTGRFNVCQGIVATAQGFGAAVSALFAEYVTQWYGYSAAFLTLAAIATIPFLLFLFLMPETRIREGAEKTNR